MRLMSHLRCAEWRQEVQPDVLLHRRHEPPMTVMNPQRVHEEATIRAG